MHFTMGGNRINYPGKVATSTAEMLMAKLLFNSIISTSGAKFMTMDISNFYLMTPLMRPEYLRLELSDIPAEVITKYQKLMKDPILKDVWTMAFLEVFWWVSTR